MSEAYEDTGSHLRYVPTPDGLDVRCIVCGAKPGEYCWNPVTNPRRHRRLNVSCLGRVKRSPRQGQQPAPVRGSTGHTDGNTGHSSEELDRD